MKTGVKEGKVGVYFFPNENDPELHLNYTMAEETFADGYWITAEVIFYSKPKSIPKL